MGVQFEYNSKSEYTLSIKFYWTVLLIRSTSYHCRNLLIQKKGVHLGHLTVCSQSDLLNTEQDILEQVCLFISHFIHLFALPTQSISEVSDTQLIEFSIDSITIYHSSTAQLFYRNVIMLLVNQTELSANCRFSGW